MLVLQPAPALPPLNGAPDHDRAIVATLLYFDLFEFPLRADELVRFAHGGAQNGHFTPGEVAHESVWWESREGMWYLKGRSHLIARRAALQPSSTEKLALARRWARLLQLIPGVRFIGITGSLAMESAVPEDDIDFLVIAARDRLWITRALVLSALFALGVKRADDGRMEHPNRVCANIFLREDDLLIADYNLFIAHEICQMLPLLGPDTYLRFIQSNAWTREYLPQWQPRVQEWQDRRTWRTIQRAFEKTLGNGVGTRLDGEVARRQLARIRAKHARGHNPGVKISETQLRFHPRDLSDYIVNTFDAHWQALNRREETRD